MGYVKSAQKCLILIFNFVYVTMVLYFRYYDNCLFEVRDQFAVKNFSFTSFSEIPFHYTVKYRLYFISSSGMCDQQDQPLLFKGDIIT